MNVRVERAQDFIPAHHPIAVFRIESHFLQKLVESLMIDGVLEIDVFLLTLFVRIFAFDLEYDYISGTTIAWY